MASCAWRARRTPRFTALSPDERHLLVAHEGSDTVCLAFMPGFHELMDSETLAS